MNNKIKISVIVGIMVAGLYLLPISMNVQAQGEKVNGVAFVDFDYVIDQNYVTGNVTGNPYVTFFNLTGAATATLTQVPIDIKPAMTDTQRENEYARQIKVWGNTNTNFNITKVSIIVRKTINV